MQKNDKLKRILYISPDFNYSCGVSKHVYINLKYLSDNSEQVLFFATNKGDSLERLANIARLNVSRMNFEKDHKNIFKLIFDFYKLYFFCVKNKIDIIHTHHRYPELLSILVSKFSKIKTITTIHSFVNGLNTISFRSKKIIAVSKAIEEHLYKNYPHTKGNCITCYNCIDDTFVQDDYSNYVQLKKNLGYDSNDKLLLFVGRLNKIKGIDILIKAYRIVKLTYPQVKLILIGNILDNTFKEMNVKSDENILRLSARADINLFFELCDIVILPSMEDPFPYVMLEAGFFNKPFIGSRTGGIAEFIEDGVNGFLFEPENAYDLAEKIKFVINNPDIAESAVEELQKKVKKYCNCEEYFAKLTKIYNELLTEL